MSVGGVGIDVADVDRFARLLVARGDAFAERWFTDAEIADSRRQPDQAAALAGFFAVKEAVWKALGPSGWNGPLAWRQIEVLSADPGGADVTVRLSGRAAELMSGSASVHATLCTAARVAVATAVVEGC